MGQDIIANALPYLSMVLINISPVSPSATVKNPQISPKPSHQKIVWEVKENETLGGIASAYYGENAYWRLIVEDNPWIKDTNSIEKGWKLSLRNLPLDSKIAEKIEKEDEESKQQLTFAPQVGAVQIVATPTSNPVQATPTPPSNFDDVYKEAGAKYGVPWQILYGIHLTETGLRDGAIFNGSGSGARGPMQFMPGTFKAYAVSASGGKPNIDEAKDAIFTAANYMAKHGSIDNGLKSYGGNYSGVLAAARARGFNR